MKSLRIADTTLCQSGSYTFKDKLHIARLLDELQVDIIEFPAFEGSKQDALLVRTVASSLTHSRISLGVNNPKSLAAAKEILADCRGVARLETYVSPVGMEYLGKKKAPQMLAWITQAIGELAAYDVEFCALDATRAEKEFLASAIDAAVKAGAGSVCLCDNAAVAMPDVFADFVNEIVKGIEIPVGIQCNNQNGMALANAFVASKKGGACIVKTSVGQEGVGLEAFGTLLHNCGLNEGLSCGLDYTHLHHALSDWSAKEETYRHADAVDSGIRLDKEDSAETVKAAVEKIGYELSDDDYALVYEEFLRVAAKKSVGAKELDAIVASCAMQVPSLYKVESFVVNNSNLFSSSAQVTLSRDGVQLQGIRFADGPIAAAFLALEEIIGQHYELDDFQIAAVTEGQGAMGKAMVKLRQNGKVYSGTGLSTDIIGAAIRAYVSAVNKIAYEES